MDESAGSAIPAPAKKVEPTIRQPAPRSPAFAETLLDVVSQLTGYPREMLELDMDIEADLGIDSIKRVEILAGVESRIPGAASVKPDHMGSLRTLRQIADYCESHGGSRPQSKPANAPIPEDERRRPSPAQKTVRLRRRELRAIALPKADRQSIPIATNQTILVTEDGGRFSRLVAEEISARGIAARLIRLEERFRGTDGSSVGGLIVIAPASASNASLWDAHNETFLHRAFALAKSVSAELRASAGSGGALLATVSRMDGRFGLAGGAFGPVQGGLAGLAKTAAHEWPGVTCRAVDVALSWSDDVAAAKSLVGELASTAIMEVGLDATGRYGIELADAASEIGSPSLKPGDVVIVTGGARGVTAEAAVALARGLRPTLVLVGRTAETEEPAWLRGVSGEAAIKQAILAHEFTGRPRPSPAEVERAYARRTAVREIRQTLERIRACGSPAEYHSVDVCDEAAVRSLVETVRSRHGTIRGLIHGAGVVEDRRIEDKTPEQFARVFDTKVAGLRHFLATLSLDELRQVLLFSSVSARFGNPGQVDYAMANEALNKIAQTLARQIPAARISAINWGPWDGGMVHAGLKRHFRECGVELIPLDAGAAAMVDEIQSSRPSVEVVLGDGWDAARAVGPANEPRSGSIIASVAPPATAGRLDFTMAFERRLDLDRHAILRSHVLGGRPVLPVAMMMEWMGHAAVHMNPGLLLTGLDELRVLRGVAIEDTSPVLRFMTSRSTRSGEVLHVQVELRSGHRGEREVIHARATAVLSANRPTAPSSEEPADLVARPYPHAIEDAYSQHLFHGSHLQGIQEILGISANGLRARLRAAPAPVHWLTDALRSDWLADPLVIDAAFQLAILWCIEEMGDVSLPTFIGRYRQFRNSFPRDSVEVLLMVRDRARNRMTGDFTFLDAQGAAVARIEGYECTVDGSLRSAFRSTGMEAAVS